MAEQLSVKNASKEVLSKFFFMSRGFRRLNLPFFELAIKSSQISLSNAATLVRLGL